MTGSSMLWGSPQHRLAFRNAPARFVCRGSAEKKVHTHHTQKKPHYHLPSLDLSPHAHDIDVHNCAVCVCVNIPKKSRLSRTRARRNTQPHGCSTYSMLATREASRAPCVPRRVYIDLGVNWCNTIMQYRKHEPRGGHRYAPWEVFGFEASPLIQPYDEDLMAWLDGAIADKPVSCLPPTGSSRHLSQWAPLYGCPASPLEQMRTCLWARISPHLSALRPSARLNRSELIDQRLRRASQQRCMAISSSNVSAASPDAVRIDRHDSPLCPPRPLGRPQVDGCGYGHLRSRPFAAEATHRALMAPPAPMDGFASEQWTSLRGCSTRLRGRIMSSSKWTSRVASSRCCETWWQTAPSTLSMSCTVPCKLVSTPEAQEARPFGEPTDSDAARGQERARGKHVDDEMSIPSEAELNVRISACNSVRGWFSCSKRATLVHRELGQLQ